MKHTALFTFAVLAACGGPDEQELAESADFVIDDDAERSAADSIEAELDHLASTPKLNPLVSRVRLTADPGCPDRITDGMDVPWRCLEVRTGRHPLIGDVDVIRDGEVTIRFRALHSFFADQLRHEASLDCEPGKEPNRIADLHSPQTPKFLAAGFVRTGGGGRRYTVLFRRVNETTYKTLPARPRLGLGEWGVFKPGAAACLRYDD